MASGRPAYFGFTTALRSSRNSAFGTAQTRTPPRKERPVFLRSQDKQPEQKRRLAQQLHPFRKGLSQAGKQSGIRRPAGAASGGLQNRREKPEDHDGEPDRLCLQQALSVRACPPAAEAAHGAEQGIGRQDGAAEEVGKDSQIQKQHQHAFTEGPAAGQLRLLIRVRHEVKHQGAAEQRRHGIEKDTALVIGVEQIEVSAVGAAENQKMQQEKQQRKADGRKLTEPEARFQQPLQTENIRRD